MKVSNFLFSIGAIIIFFLVGNLVYQNTFGTKYVVITQTDTLYVQTIRYEAIRGKEYIACLHSGIEANWEFVEMDKIVSLYEK